MNDMEAPILTSLPRFLQDLQERRQLRCQGRLPSRSPSSCHRPCLRRPQVPEAREARG